MLVYKGVKQPARGGSSHTVCMLSNCCKHQDRYACRAILQHSTALPGAAPLPVQGYLCASCACTMLSAKQATGQLAVVIADGSASSTSNEQPHHKLLCGQTANSTRNLPGPSAAAYTSRRQPQQHSCKLTSQGYHGHCHICAICVLQRSCMAAPSLPHDFAALLSSHLSRAVPRHCSQHTTPHE